jgi:hypothetical protein
MNTKIVVKCFNTQNYIQNCGIDEINLKKITIKIVKAFVYIEFLTF